MLHTVESARVQSFADTFLSVFQPIFLFICQNFTQTPKKYIFRGCQKSTFSGAVLSPILYCIYIGHLFKTFRRRRIGCWVNNYYIGIVGYADDLLLLATSIDSLHDMVKTCEQYADSHNLEFSISSEIKKCKTKCMAFAKKNKTLRRIKLNGKELPWVDSSKHLGAKLTNPINGLAQDSMEKRALFVNKVNKL